MKTFSFVVCAAGRSERYRNQVSDRSIISKQFEKWGEKPLFLHSLHALDLPETQEVALVVSPGFEDAFAAWTEKESFGFELKIVPGGSRRQDSVRHGLLALSPTRFVGIHDGARPLLSRDLMTRLFEKVKTVSAVIPVLPIVETIKEIDSEGLVVKTYDRSRFVRVQTPQMFEYSLIRKIHLDLENSEVEFTDDAAMAESQGLAVATVVGDPQNLKVTVPRDLETVKKKVQHA